MEKLQEKLELYLMELPILGFNSGKYYINAAKNSFSHLVKHEQVMFVVKNLKPTTDDEERLKTNILPGETSAFEQYVRKKSYRHSPNLNTMYNTEK